jgi:hypothetical protein
MVLSGRMRQKSKQLAWAAQSATCQTNGGNHSITHEDVASCNSIDVFVS